MKRKTRKKRENKETKEASKRKVKTRPKRKPKRTTDPGVPIDAIDPLQERRKKTQVALVIHLTQDARDKIGIIRKRMRLPYLSDAIMDAVEHYYAALSPSELQHKNPPV